MAIDQPPLASMTVEQWEGLCQRCGRCCYGKVDYNDQIYLTAVPCEFLDLHSRQCTIYEQRCSMKKECVPLSPEVIALGVLPEGCPYRALVPSASAPRSWRELPPGLRRQLGLAP
ncbi:MAG: hypothetical protein J7K75_10170 [Desulfuromonas sp.]|nr:hypothetical protein [Desulfuromonas sp.]